MSVKITFEADDKTAAGIASVVANIGKVESAAEKATGSKGGNKGVGGLSGALGGLNQALGAVGLPAIGFTAVVGGLTAATVKSYKAFQDYAGTVRDTALVTGTGAKESSKLLQVLDDYQISAEGVTQASRAMKDQGLVPTVETLATLSDQFLKIQDPAARMKFVFDNFGRSGTQFINLLNQGGAAILQMSDGANKNLILSEEQVAMSEKSRLAIDTISDAWEGMKVAAGSALGQIIVDSDEARTKSEAINGALVRMGRDGLFAMNDMQRQRQPIAQMLDMMYEQAQATGISFKDMKAPLDSATMSYIAMAKAQATGTGALQGEGATLDYASMISSATSLTKVQTSYKKAVDDVTNAFRDSGYVKDLYKAQQAELNKELKNGEINTKQYNAAMGDLYKSFNDGSFKASEQAKALKGVSDAQASQISQVAFGGLDKETDPKKYYETAQAMGFISKEAAQQGIAIDKLNKAWATGKIQPNEYAEAVKKLSGGVMAMNGMNAVTFIDVYIRTHGTMPGTNSPLSAPTAPAPGTSASSGFDASGGSYNLTGKATGDKNLPGGLFEVGEQGREGLYMTNGRVSIIPAGLWGRMKEYGITPTGGFAGGLTGTSASGSLSRGATFPSRTGSLLSAPTSPALETLSTTTAAIVTMQQQINTRLERLENPAPIDLSSRTIRQMGQELGVQIDLRNG